MQRSTFCAVVVVMVLALCLVALSISSWLMGVHAPIKNDAEIAAQKNSLWAVVCGGVEEHDTAGCEKVAKSFWGSVLVPWYVVYEVRTEDEDVPSVFQTRWSFISVPVAQIGLCYYLFILVWFVFTGVPRRASCRWHLLPLLASIGAVLTSVFYLCIMAFILKEWCRLCLILHGIDFLLVAAMVVLWPRRRREAETEPAQPPRLQPAQALAALACAAALAACTFVHRNGQLRTAQVSMLMDRCQKQYEKVKTDEAFLVSAFRGTPAREIPKRATAPAMSFGPSPKHEVVVFSDLLCPYCRRFEERFKAEFVEPWGGELKLSMRHFPLCEQCNSSQTRSIHPQSCQAAYAVEAARVQGGEPAFWRMHDLILANQQGLSKESDWAALDEFARQLSLDAVRLRQDMDSPAVRQAVADDVEAGIKLGIHATPAVFLNGRKISPIQHDSKAFWESLARLARLNEQGASDKDSTQPKAPQP